MPHYYFLGKIPRKRHVVFKKQDENLYAEQLISTEGFSSIYSLTYHCSPPTNVFKVDEAYSVVPDIVLNKNMQHRSFQGFKVDSEEDYLKSRKPLLVNEDIYKIGRASCRERV